MLAIQNLGFARGKNILFEDLSFSMNAGDAVRVTGSNGSGKTTLLRIVSGLCRPDIGTVTWRGDLARKNDNEFVRSVNFIGHDDGLKKQLTATENLKLMLPLLGTYPSDGEIESALDAAGITLTECRRDWDTAIWPHSTAGFFKVKKNIPLILHEVGLT